MTRLLERRFEAAVPLAEAWRVLARVGEWPRWAGHIRSVSVAPPGELGPASAGTLHLTNGVSSTFRMSEFVPGSHWTWVGPFLWLEVRYEHRFEDLAPDRTRLTWVVDGQGFGVSVFGRLFARIYARSLDRAIPKLVAILEGRS